MLHAAPIPPPPAPETIKQPITVVTEVQPLPQPQEVMPIPSILHELMMVNRLFITKRLRIKSVMYLRGKKNRFFVRTPEHNLLYTVEEENSWWVGYFCYGLRPLQLRVVNRVGNEVMRIIRPYACTSRVLPCQLQHLDVFSPPGTKIGTVDQLWTAIKPVYVVKNGNGDDLFWIHGPLVTISCFKDIEFHISRTDGTAVGATRKRWQGITHALFLAPVTDRFGVAFEMDLPVEEKALLLAATLLLDYMYYDI